MNDRPKGIKGQPDRRNTKRWKICGWGSHTRRWILSASHTLVRSSPPYPKEEDIELECATCSLKCSNQSNLDRHVKIHDPPTERPVFRCEWEIEGCTAGPYKTKSDLNVHVNIKHSFGYEGAECSDCGLKFTQKSSLNRHQKTCCKKGLNKWLFNYFPLRVETSLLSVDQARFQSESPGWLSVKHPWLSAERSRRWLMAESPGWLLVKHPWLSAERSRRWLMAESPGWLLVKHPWLSAERSRRWLMAESPGWLLVKHPWLSADRSRRWLMVPIFWYL